MVGSIGKGIIFIVKFLVAYHIFIFSGLIFATARRFIPSRVFISALIIIPGASRSVVVPGAAVPWLVIASGISRLAVIAWSGRDTGRVISRCVFIRSYCCINRSGGLFSF